MLPVIAAGENFKVELVVSNLAINFGKIKGNSTRGRVQAAQERKTAVPGFIAGIIN